MPPFRIPLLAGLLWLAAIAWGFHRAFLYSRERGAPALAASAWPSTAHYPRDERFPTLVLALHPHCPCSRATLSQLERLSARCGQRLRLQVLVYADPGLGREWAESEIVQRARALPFAQVRSDPLGASARLFGARTSGQVFLFAPDGRRVFEGGITWARGHEGDSAGADAVEDFVLRGKTRVSHAPVFGCPLAAAEGETRP